MNARDGKSFQQPTYEAGLSLSLAYRALNYFMTSFLAPFTLSLPEWKLLGQLSEHPTMSPTQIARLIGVRSPIATRMLKGLERKKLLTRTRSRSDNRRVFVAITEHGKKLVHEVEHELRPALAAYLGDVDHNELAAFIKVTSQIAGKLPEAQNL